MGAHLIFQLLLVFVRSRSYHYSLNETRNGEKEMKLILAVLATDTSLCVLIMCNYKTKSGVSKPHLQKENQGISCSISTSIEERHFVD